MESPGRRTFLVECYAPDLERAAVESAARRAEEATAHRPEPRRTSALL